MKTMCLIIALKKPLPRNASPMSTTRNFYGKCCSTCIIKIHLTIACSNSKRQPHPNLWSKLSCSFTRTKLQFRSDGLARPPIPPHLLIAVAASPTISLTLLTDSATPSGYFDNFVKIRLLLYFPSKGSSRYWELSALCKFGEEDCCCELSFCFLESEDCSPPWLQHKSRRILLHRSQQDFGKIELWSSGLLGLFQSSGLVPQLNTDFSWVY